MSSRTLTNTAWGEMARDVADNGSVTLTSTCKLCHGMHVQALHPDDNPCAKVRPRHEKGCRFHPDYAKAPTIIASLPVALHAHRLPPNLILALIIALIVLAFLGGWAL